MYKRLCLYIFGTFIDFVKLRYLRIPVYNNKMLKDFSLPSSDYQLKKPYPYLYQDDILLVSIRVWELYCGEVVLEIITVAK